jgi:hypothetical protein
MANRALWHELGSPDNGTSCCPIESANERKITGAAQLSLTTPEPMAIGERAYGPGLRIARLTSEQRINKRRNR